MAISITQRGSATRSASGAGSQQVAASFTSAADSILFLVCYSSNEANPLISSVSGHGTWANVFNNGYTYEGRRLEVWACKSSGATAAVTASFPYTWKATVEVFEATGADVSGTAANAFGVSAFDEKTSGVADSTITLSLGSFGANGGVTFAIGLQHSSPSFEGGYTAFTAVTAASGWTHRCAYIDNEDTSVVVTSSAWTTAQAAAFEIKEASGGGGATPTITDAGDETYTNGETGITITGTNFGASQGTGTVKISPTDNVADSNAVTQTVTAWSDTSITFTCVRGTLALNTNLYLFVTSDGAYSNASGHVVQIAGTRKLKVLTHSSAAGATSIDVAVYAAPTTEPIHGALIGQATGQAFEASLEAGQAVLKVPVSAFGGGALTTSDTPRVLARNGTYTTGNIPATVIEE